MSSFTHSEIKIYPMAYIRKFKREEKIYYYLVVWYEEYADK